LLGLRGKIGAGFSKINHVTIIQTSQGLCRYVLDCFPDIRDRGVVIGHDHRHYSNDFAKLAAHTFLSEGIKVYCFEKLVHTPLVVRRYWIMRIDE
jgi:phosphomannomutase